MRSSWDAPKVLQWQPPEADKRAFGAAVLFQRNIVVGALKSSGTSPNFLITLASLKSPVAGATAPPTYIRHVANVARSRHVRFAARNGHQATCFVPILRSHGRKSCGQNPRRRALSIRSQGFASVRLRDKLHRCDHSEAPPYRRSRRQLRGQSGAIRSQVWLALRRPAHRFSSHRKSNIAISMSVTFHQIWTRPPAIDRAPYFL
jgi:hypothetical protein